MRSVVLTVGLRSERKLIDAPEGEKGIGLFEAGDCVRPRTIFDATHDGFRAARWAWVGDRRRDADLASSSE